MLILIILLDIFILGIGTIFSPQKKQVDLNQEYHMDRYGYFWKVDE